MKKCKLCNQNLVIANNKIVSEEGTTDVFSVMQLVCLNSKCKMYAGKDLNVEDLKVSETIKSKISEH